jgi:ABC-type lipoprotein release transport system permease subunit
MAHLALRYLFRYRRRYLFLFLALAFGFGIISFIRAAKNGMAENVYFSAQAHYAGDIIVQGIDNSYSQGHHFNREQTAFILEAAEQAGIDPVRTAVRTDLYDGAEIYFNGADLRLKYVQGVDWEAEESFFTRLDYTGAASVEPAAGNGILISESVAEFLGLQQGDDVVLETDPDGTPKNIGIFVVTGIIKDSSIFGYYKAYVDRKILNELIGFEPDDCSFVGFTMANHSDAEKKKAVFSGYLSKGLAISPLLTTKEEYNTERSKSWEGLRVFVLTIPVYLSDINQLLNAMDLLTYLLYGMMLVIILVSAGVTYRLILHERLREIGTMRAIGFHEGDVQNILILEALGLGVVSLAGGLFFAWFLSRIFSFVSFTRFSGFEIFLRNGKLTALFLPGTTVIDTLAVFCILLPAIWLLSFRVTHVKLPLLLSGDSL